MKNSKFNITIILILALSSTLLFAESGYNVNFSQSMNAEITLDFDLGNYSLEQVTKNGVTYSTINFENSVTTKKNGFAELPFIHAAVQLSDTKNVTTEVIANDYIEYLLDYPLLPSRGTIYRNQDPSSIQYEIADASITDEFYPGNIAETMEPFIIRDVRGSIVYVYPFQYNAEQNILRVFENVTIKLIENSSTPINPLNTTPERITKAMNSLYRSVFINYTETRFEHELDEFGSILVIHTPRDAAAILPYIEWKREKGFTVYVEEVATGTNVTSLVSSQFSSHDDILYVQLVGDWADISGPTDGSGKSVDPTIGCVVGGDNYPDLIVGRFSANSTTHVTTQVNKAITYERDPNMGETWYSAAIGIASNQGPGDDGEYDNVHIQNIYDNKLDPFTYDTHTPIYDPSANATMVTNAVNTGASIINYCGHGSTTSWGSSGFSNTYVNLLTNGEKLPFIISVACVNGNFQSAECFAEAWLHKSGGGAVGMLASTINMSWNPPMRGQDYINDLLIGGYDYSAHPGQNGITTDVQKTTYGAVCLNGSILMVIEDYSSGLNEMQHWTIFGDASLQVRTDTPQELSLSNTAVLMGIDFTTTITAGGSPIEGAIVALSQDDEVFYGISDSNGNVTITHELAAGICTMVVSGFNTETLYDDNVAVIPPGGPYLLLSSFETHDDNNNIPEYNEAITLDVYVENVGTDNATNIAITLSTTNDYITITDADGAVALIEDGEIVSLIDAFAFDVANDIPDQHSATFDLEMVASEGTWTAQFNITFNAPSFEAGSIGIADSGGDGILDPGETATLSFPILNTGNAASEDIIAELTTSSPDIITIIDGTFNMSELGIGEDDIASFDIEVADDATLGSDANFELTINSSGYTSLSSYSLFIGLIMENFETGDFSLFDWQMGSSGWEIDDTNAYEGTYCAKSTTISHNQTASLSVTMDVDPDGEISFYRKVSSESSYDYLKFYINNVVQDQWSGNLGWAQETYYVQAGTDIEFKWTYQKDGSVSSGSDCGWIDEIIFPASGSGTDIDDFSTEDMITELSGNYPNPFNPTTNIKFNLKNDSKVSLVIYNIRGQKVRTLVNDNLQAGSHSIVWDGRDESGKSVSSGVYFNGFDASSMDGDYTSIKKMILLK